MPPRILMVAGEASGDLHGSGVVHALRALAPGVVVTGIGGDWMKAEGMELLHHIGDLAFMGFAEVVRNLRTIRLVERKLTRALEENKPDVVVLIDYPGFNLRFARVASSRGIPVLYYISPQVWAWHKGRVKSMRRFVDRMDVVFPFEVGIYREAGMNVAFVGHPLVERICVRSTREDFFRRHGLSSERPLLALLPGSRRQEIDRIFPVMLAASEALCRSGDLQCAIGVAPNLGRELLEPRIPEGVKAKLVENETYELMAYADAAIVTSGTATLETGWFGTPMAVVYRTSMLTYLIGRMLVRVPYIGLVNIVAGRKVVPEFVQGAMTPEALRNEVGRMLSDQAYAQSIRQGLSVIRKNLGGPGASERVARDVLELVKAA